MQAQDISKQYNSKDTEAKWYKYWLENGFFFADPDKGGKSYSVVIPPPNITGILHMGHALNNSIQDILVRWKRMQGFNSLWMPGTDHAGIATQNVVERNIKNEGLSREDLGRQKFLEKVWEWREEYGNTIINQLKRLGCSCDWSKTRFTMDAGLNRAVNEVFIRLYEKGLIYQGNYIINWCPRCKTALSDEESEHKELKGFLYYIKYPVSGSEGEYITVATTRPETMLGDTAIAYNPSDKRYKHLHGKTVILPIIERTIRTVADDYVDPAFGTGIVKITPGHDPNDFVIGQRHNLNILNVMNDDATMNEHAGPYSGQDRFECREALLVDLKERGLLEKTETHNLSVGHCYRCHTIVEPKVSKQWFVKMKPLAKSAISAVEKGHIKFFPGRWTKVYLDWMYNIKDWCISRQIWWGHRIPVWYCKQCQTGNPKSEVRSPKKTSNGVVASIDKPEKCPDCGSVDLVQDPDVLDTWFSSWLWPFSTMGWPNETKELKFYYPTDVLVTAQEIIFFWVARMIMAGMEFIGKIPFREVYIHGTVRDETGTKMSKSLGNVIDPLEIIDEFGADALRFSIIAITSQGQDVFLSRHKFETGRNFNNKIWNASRFLMMNLQPHKDLGELPRKTSWTSDDWFIMGKLQAVIKDVSNNLKSYRFKEASQNLYDFFWHDFCDKYIEIVKPDIKEKPERQQILFHVLVNSLRLLHPIIPFITEDIWQRLKDFAPNNVPSIMTAPWPEYKKECYDKSTIDKASEKYDFIRSGRVLRSEYNVEPQKRVLFHIKPNSKKVQGYLLEDIESLKRLLNASEIEIDSKFKTKKPMPAGVTQNGTIYMSLKGLDISKERSRLEKELEKIANEIKITKSKLANRQFCEKAPKDIIEKTKNKMKEFTEKQEKIKAHLEYL